MGIADILNIARSSLIANQQALQVLSHNIANAATEGYSRQRVNFTTNMPLVTASGVFGRGINSDSVLRAEDRFITQRLLIEKQAAGKWTAIDRNLKEIELSFSDIGSSDLSAIITNFFNAAEQLSLNPENLAARTNLLQRAEFMTSKFRTISETLARAQMNIDSEIRTVANKVNDITANIANINSAILVVEAGGNRANDLRDSRDILLGELSDLVNANIFENNQGGVVVSLDGNILVDGKTRRELILTQKAVSNRSITILTIKGSPNALKFDGGRLAGLIEVRDNYIGTYRSALDTMAKDLSNSVNALHYKGFDLNGNTGINFFKTNIESASDMAISDDIKDDITKIAAAGGYDSNNDDTIDLTNGPGDNSVLRAIASLRNSGIDKSGNNSIFDSYGSLLGTVASDTNQSNDMMETQIMLVNQIRNMKESRVGVSLDEELVKMIVFQNNYAAASRMIKMVDRLMQSIMDMVA